MSEAFYTLDVDLRKAVDEAKAIISSPGLEQRFPLNISMNSFVVLNGTGRLLETKKVTLHRPEPEIIEQFFDAIDCSIIGLLKIDPINPVVDYEIKTNRLKVAEHTVISERKCPICDKSFPRNFVRHVKRCSNNSYCLHCSSRIDGDMSQHQRMCRTKTYPCIVCDQLFVNAASLRCHQAKCRLPAQGGAGIQVIYLLINC